MRIDHDVPLAPLTTLRLGGPARTLVSAATADDAVEAVARADRAGEPLLVLAGASNVVIADQGFAGTVVLLRSRGIETAEGHGGTVRLTVQAGEDWDPFVARCVGEGLAGIEALSGIPGSVGATPIQNVGAYGQEVAQTIVAVRAYDRRERAIVELEPQKCGFAYRDSAFKRSDRHLVLAVTFALRRTELGGPVSYPELARALGVQPGAAAPPRAVREAVLGLRRSKGMVIDPADPDSVSVGSFFTNPWLEVDAFAALARRAAQRLGDGSPPPPSYPAADGFVKTSAAWLIERAGFARGYRRGPVAVSDKHTLALTNRGGARSADLIALAREIRDGVRDAFDVTLVPEPVFVGCAWD